MALFPAGLPPVPHQRSIRIYIAFGLCILCLLILCIYGFSRNEDNTVPVGIKYYIKAQKDESWIEKLIGDPVALFTLALTAFTGGLYISTRGLWRSTEQLAALAESQAMDTREALLIAGNNAAAAEKTANAMLASEKPYVKEIVTRVDFDEAFKIRLYNNSPTMPAQNCRLYLWFVFKNYGKTPAEIIEYCLRIEICQYQPMVSAERDSGLVVSDFNLQEPTLAAQGQTEPMQQIFEEEVSWIISQELVRKQKNIWFLGWIAWYDVFGNKTFRYFTWKYDHRRRLFIPRDPATNSRSYSNQGPA